MKYVGKCHALLGAIALAERNSSRAIEELSRALGIARQIGYPVLTWQAAHRLAGTEWEVGKRDDAFAHARLAAETIATLANRIPEPALRETFLARASVNDAQALFDHLGIDYRHTAFLDHRGRPMPILDSGEPIRELL